MLLEGVELYLKLIRVFETPIPLKGVFFGVGYGIPALFVIVAAPATPASFGNEEICWLRGEERRGRQKGYENNERVRKEDRKEEYRKKERKKGGKKE